MEPCPNDDPVYVELRARVKRLCLREGKQGLENRYLRLGQYSLGVFTGDGPPYHVYVGFNSPPPTRGISQILSDTTGGFDKERCKELLTLLRTKMVLDDLADV